MTPPKSHRIMVNGEKIRLPMLNDDEYEAVEAQAAKARQSLDRCPTCKGKRIDTDADDVYGWENGQYRFRGETYECDCIGQMALYRHYLHAAIPLQYMQLDWEDFEGNPQIKTDIDRYIAGWKNFLSQGMGVTLFGDLGRGKTFAATSIAKGVVKQGEQVFFTEFRSLRDAYDLLTIDDRQTLERRTRESALLVLDEVSEPVSKAQEGYFERVLESLIRYRTNWNLPTIITTNLRDEQLREYYPRVFSLLSPKQWVMELEGYDYREDKAGVENIELAANGEVRPLV